jgi:general secretion pathway protein M
MKRLPWNRSRVLALALLALVLIVAYAILVMPYTAYVASARDRVSALSDQLLRYRSLVSMEDRVREHLRKIEDDESAASDFLDATTPALASADLQQYIKTAVQEAGGNLVSTQALPSDEDAELVGATVRVGIRGNSDTLYALLYTLEERQPIVHIGNLQLRGLARTGMVTKDGDRLDIRFELTGYLRSDAR